LTRKSTTLSADYFEEKYKADIDPWRFRSSDYEHDKYQATLESLTKCRYLNALEVGCSIGVFTKLLGPRCDHLLALDASATAIAVAKASNDSNVEFRIAALPAEFPEGGFDLIVLSEVLYYFAAPDLDRVARLCLGSLSPGGEIILCHWLGETDYPLSGIEASERFARQVKEALPVRSILQDAVYRLERYSAG
jgi:SAM-dependent methyltransferase